MGKSKNKKAARVKKETSGRRVRQNLLRSKERKEDKNAVWREEV